MRRIAFTLTELVVTLIVITLAVTVTLPITKKKLEKADKIGYYRAYQIANDISKQLKIKDFADTYLESSSASANYDFEYCQQPLYSCTFEYREKVTCEGQEHTWTEVPIEYCQPDKLSEITDCDWNDQDCDIHFTSDPTPMGYTVGDKYSSDATIKENPFDRVIKIAKEKIFEFDKFLARITKPTNPNHIGLCPAAWASGTCTLSPEDDGSYQGGCSCGQTQITVDDEGDCSMAAAQMLNTCWGCYVDYHFSGPSGGGSGSGSGSGSGGGSGGGSGNYHACDSFAKLHSEIPNNPWTFNGSCKWVDASFGLCKNI